MLPPPLHHENTNCCGIVVVRKEAVILDNLEHRNIFLKTHVTNENCPDLGILFSPEQSNKMICCIY